METIGNKLLSDTIIKINIKEKFVGERGRINCSLRDPSGFWRWLDTTICNN